MSYNLLWWKLFDLERGPQGHLTIQGNTATQLIIKALQATPYDVIGFQECEDEQWLVSHAGMAAEYTIFRDRACCMAYRKRLWTLVGRGVNYVADDARFGMRPAQWMRLRHTKTGKTMFFVNHHGPLPISSGGMCGGYAHAYNLLKVFASHSQPGDAAVLVGDMNADPASESMKRLADKLTLVYGGWRTQTKIDFVFSNLPKSAVVAAVDLGGGGSDHNALKATLHVGSGTPANAPSVAEAFMPQSKPPRARPARGLCSKEREDRFEYGITYIVAPGSGRLHFQGLGDQTACCLKCRSMPRCKSFTYTQSGDCRLYGALPTEKRLEHGTVSGLPLREEENEEVYAEEVEESAEVREEEKGIIAASKDSSGPKPKYAASFGQVPQGEPGTPPAAATQAPVLQPSLPTPGAQTPAPLPAPGLGQPLQAAQPQPAYHLSMPPGQPHPQGGLAGALSRLGSMFHLR